jgi:hypothetical protein
VSWRISWSTEGTAGTARTRMRYVKIGWVFIYIDFSCVFF